MLLSMGNNGNIALNIWNVSIDVANSVKLLGNTMDTKLKFNWLVAELCQKQTTG